VIPSFTFKIGNNKHKLKDIRVNTERAWAGQGNEDGAIGMDLII